MKICSLRIFGGLLFQQQQKTQLSRAECDIVTDIRENFDRNEYPNIFGSKKLHK